MIITSCMKKSKLGFTHVSNKMISFLHNTIITILFFKNNSKEILGYYMTRKYEYKIDTQSDRPYL